MRRVLCDNTSTYTKPIIPLNLGNSRLRYNTMLFFKFCTVLYFRQMVVSDWFSFIRDFHSYTNIANTSNSHWKRSNAISERWIPHPKQKKMHAVTKVKNRQSRTAFGYCFFKLVLRLRQYFIL